jgi:alpha-N-acetylglucosamine transferase
MVVEVWVKTGNGIRYAIQRIEPVANPAGNVKEWVDKTRKFGLESYRPYTPGQHCDGTISSCVTALFTDLCRHRNINPIQVWNTAYPDEKPKMNKKELEATKAFADWQGVAYPKEWDAVQVELMLESLHNINYQQLATVVQEELGLG